MESNQNIKIFENEKFGQIRTIEVNNEPYFVGKDIAIILGYELAARKPTSLDVG